MFGPTLMKALGWALILALCAAAVPEPADADGRRGDGRGHSSRGSRGGDHPHHHPASPSPACVSAPPVLPRVHLTLRDRHLAGGRGADTGLHSAAVHTAGLLRDTSCVPLVHAARRGVSDRSLRAPRRRRDVALRVGVGSQPAGRATATTGTRGSASGDSGHGRIAEAARAAGRDLSMDRRGWRNDLDGQPGESASPLPRRRQPVAHHAIAASVGHVARASGPADGSDP